MSSLLVHGVYDYPTFETLSHLGIAQFGFDLRGKSPNLIPYRDLNNLLPRLIGERAFLVFEDDRETTVLSFLNLLKNAPLKLILEFRDSRPASFYQSLNHDFVWMFRPDSDWKEILNCEKLVGILLPYELRDNYSNFSYLWETIERRNLEVFVHAKDLKQASLITPHVDMKLSMDLTLEVENGFRHVDQDYLKKWPLWSKYNENSARQ